MCLQSSLWLTSQLHIKSKEPLEVSNIDEILELCKEAQDKLFRRLKKISSSEKQNVTEINQLIQIVTILIRLDIEKIGNQVLQDEDLIKYLF